MPSLPSYEDMMKDHLFNGPRSMETQPDTLQVLEEGIAVTQDRQTVELWQDEELVNLLEYLEDENKPLHTNFVLPNKRLSP